MKKVLLLILAGGLLAGCYHIPKAAAPVQQPVPAEENKTMEEAPETEKNTVTYLDSGFAPKSITVKVGTTVIWKNTGNKTMRVASAVHPTHQELPGFDQLQTVGNGGSYSYTFTKAGTWKYHSHVSPGETGTVIVEE